MNNKMNFDFNNKLKNDNEPKELLNIFSEKSEINLKKKNHIEKFKKRIHSNQDILNDFKVVESIIRSDSFNKFINSQENELLEESKSFIQSMITLSDWFDEIEDGGCMGLAINVSTNYLTKLGHVNNLEISTTTTFVPMVDYLILVLKYFEDNKDDDNFGNLNFKNIINGNIIGNGNLVFPLYINKHHWKISKIFMNPILGLAVAHNPKAYNKSYDILPFIILSEILKKTLVTDFKISNRWTQVLIIFMRTCSEFAFDKKFQRGIENYINKILDNPLMRVDNFKTTIQKIVGQSISTGYKIEDNQIKKLVKYFIEDEIRLYLRKENYDKTYINFLKNECKNPKEDMNELLNLMIMDQGIIDAIKISKTLIFSNKIFSNFYNSFGSFSKFIKEIDESFGILNEKKINELNGLIIGKKCDKTTFEDLYKCLNEDFNSDELMIMVAISSLRTKNKDMIKEVNHNKYKNCLNYEKISIEEFLNKVEI